MEQTTQIINQVLPILMLIFLGYWIRYKRFLTEVTIDELRKIVVNLALPAVLFISFLSIELKWSYFVIFGFHCVCHLGDCRYRIIPSCHIICNQLDIPSDGSGSGI